MLVVYETLKNLPTNSGETFLSRSYLQRLLVDLIVTGEGIAGQREINLIMLSMYFCSES